MSKERRILFQSIDEGDGLLSTECRAKDIDDLEHIATSIILACKENEMFMLMLLTGIKALVSDENFQKALDESSIDCPDFDKILKDENNG